MVPSSLARSWPAVLRSPRRLVLILSIVTVWVRLMIGILSRWLEQLWVYRWVSYVDHAREAVFAKPSKFL
ncbi:hypothetical protein AN946_01995 [Trueperella pyogenes]|nr:hypothetical protein AN946_01995 [Trueperella pyogenes]